MPYLDIHLILCCAPIVIAKVTISVISFKKTVDVVIDLVSELGFKFVRISLQGDKKVILLFVC